MDFSCTAVVLLATRSKTERDCLAGWCLILDEQWKYDFSPLQTYLFVKWQHPPQVCLYYQSSLIIQVYLRTLSVQEKTPNCFMSSPRRRLTTPTPVSARCSRDFTACFKTTIKTGKLRLIHLKLESLKQSVQYRRNKLHFYMQDKAVALREREPCWGGDAFTRTDTGACWGSLLLNTSTAEPGCESQQHPDQFQRKAVRK